MGRMEPEDQAPSPPQDQQLEECIAKNYHITGYVYKKLHVFLIFQNATTILVCCFKKLLCSLMTILVNFNHVYDILGPLVSFDH